MAGPIPGSSENILASAVTLGYQGSTTDPSSHDTELLTGQAYGAHVWVDVTTWDGVTSATGDCTIEIYARTGANGIDSSHPIMVRSVDPNQDNYRAYFPINTPGAYVIRVTNNDAAVNMTLNAIYVVKLT